MAAMISVYTLLVGLEGAVIMLISMFDVGGTAKRLRHEDRNAASAHAEVQRFRLRTNSSIAAKKDDHSGAT